MDALKEFQRTVLESITEDPKMRKKIKKAIKGLSKLLAKANSKKSVEEIEEKEAALKEEFSFDLSSLINPKGNSNGAIFGEGQSLQAGFISNGFMLVRNSGKFKNVAFALNRSYTWTLVEDSLGILCLVPLKKIE